MLRCGKTEPLPIPEEGAMLLASMPGNVKIAVKIINHYGDEVLKAYEV
jgi:hypothetical protein